MDSIDGAKEGKLVHVSGAVKTLAKLVDDDFPVSADGVKLLRADSGFWNSKVFKRLERAGWQYSIGVRMQKGVREAVEAIDEDAWQTIDYPDEGEAQTIARVG